MRDLALAAVLLTLLPFVLKRPSWGILMLVWLGYMNPHLLCYGFMVSMPVVQVVAIFTLIGMLLSKEPKRFVFSREIAVLMLFIGWMGVTTAFALYPELAFDQLIKVLKIQVLTLMALMLLTSRDMIDKFVWVIVLSLGFYGVKGGIFTILHGGAYRVNGPGGFIGGNNELALALAMTVPLMRYLQLQAKRRAVRIGLGVGMLLTTLAAIGSQSRGALVALVLMGAIFWFKSRQKLLTGTIVLVAVVTVALLMPESWYTRMSTIETYSQDESAIGRLNAWAMAYNLANARFLGGGFEAWQWGTFQLYAPDPENVRAPHSIYFQVLGEHGWLGLGLFLLLIALTWLKCGSIIRLAKKRPEIEWARDLAAMIQVSLVAYLSAGAFLGLANFDYFYHLVAITVMVYYLITRPQQAGAGVPAAATGVPRHVELLPARRS